MVEKQQPITINEPPADDFVGHIKVTNHNDFDLQDHYDGHAFTFKPNVPVTVPVEVARHIFGFGLAETDQQNYVLRRFGWNTVEMTKERQNLKLWKNLDIRPVRFRMIEVATDDDDGESRKFEVTKRPVGRPPKIARHPDMILDDDPVEPKSAS